MRPSLSYGYAPSFDQFYDEYINGDTGDVVQFSRFQGTLNGAPSLGKSNSLSFSLANTLEAKVRDKDSTATEAKKISILNNLNFSTGYNFESDSLRLSPISFNGGTTILNNKLSINFSGSLDPYAIDNNGRRFNTFNIDKKKKNLTLMIMLPLVAVEMMTFLVELTILKTQEEILTKQMRMLTILFMPLKYLGIFD